MRTFADPLLMGQRRAYLPTQTISKTIGEQHVQSQETIIVQCLFNDKSQAQGLDHVNFR